MDTEKILVIDDEKNILNNITTILTEEGYNVITSSNGKHGIEIAKKEKPTLIICDITMPVMDGYCVLRELSKFNDTKAIPFVFLTAKSEREDIRKGMQLGADDYLVKPFTIEELTNSISSRLKRISVLKESSGENIDEKDFVKKYSDDDKFIIKTGENPKIIKIKDIIYISAENQYTMINLTEDKSYRVRKSIAKWLESLPNNKFIRIHRSQIINIDYIARIEKWYNSSYIIYLRDIQNAFVVSKRYSSQLRQNMF